MMKVVPGGRRILLWTYQRPGTGLSSSGEQHQRGMNGLDKALLHGSTVHEPDLSGGGFVLSRRAPMLLLRLPGSLLLRFAERRLTGLLFQLPPRLTRLEPFVPFIPAPLYRNLMWPLAYGFALGEEHGMKNKANPPRRSSPKSALNFWHKPFAKESCHSMECWHVNANSSNWHNGFPFTILKRAREIRFQPIFKKKKKKIQGKMSK